MKQPRVKDRRRPAALIPSATTSDRLALVPTNPRVKSIAFRFRWRPDTVVERVRTALPSVVEQQLYLRVGGAFRIHPETIRKMLDVFIGPGEQLRPEDLDRRQIGENLIASRFDDVAEKIETALSLLDKGGDVAGFAMTSVARVATLVEVYGESAEDVLGILVEHLDEVRDRLGLGKDVKAPAVFGVALERLCARIADGLLPIGLEEMFETIEGARNG